MMRFGPRRADLGYAPTKSGTGIWGRSMDSLVKLETPLQLLAQFEPVEHKSTGSMQEQLATLIPLRDNLGAILKYCGVPSQGNDEEVFDTLVELQQQTRVASKTIALVLYPLGLADFNAGMAQIEAECGKVKATLSYYYWLVDRTLCDRQELETAF